jgi:hypothetical protein
VREGRVTLGCEKLAASLALYPGPGTRFNLADCQVKSGKLASAWANYLDVAAETERAGDEARAAAARDRASSRALPSSTSRWATGLEIQSNGRPVPRGQWGTAVPVDPGAITVAARLGESRWRRTVRVAEGERADVRVPDLSAAERSRAGTPPEALDESSGRASVTGWVLLGVGAAATVAGAIVWGVGLGQQADAEEICPDRECPTPAQAPAGGPTLSEIDEAKRQGDSGVIMAWIGGAVGVAGLVTAIVGGVVLIGSAASADDRDDTARGRSGPGMVLGPGPGVAGLGVAGAF